MSLSLPIIDMVLTPAQRSVEERAMEVLTSRARNSKNGCFRLFDRTMNNIIRLMREREQTTITETIINEASAMMLL